MANSSQAEQLEGMDALKARDFYAERGIDTTIPLPRNSKSPAWLGANWNTRPTDELWRGRSPDCNIGLRFPVANNMIAFDADDKTQVGTAANVSARLAGLGLAPVVYQTPLGGGQRFCVICPDAPDIGRRNLDPKLGAGELYVSAGQVVLPWSVINGRPYRPTAGSWDAIPSVSWEDIGSWAIPAVAVQPARQTSSSAAGVANIGRDALPVRLPWRPMPAEVSQMLDALKGADAGASIGRYKSTSEAEQAVITSLALCGWNWEQIADVFSSARPSHFARSKAPFAYLRRSWRKAIGHLCQSDKRQQLADIYADVLARPWTVTRRTRGTDRAVYMAVIGQLWAANADEVTASVRELAEAAAVGRMTSQRALGRLRRVQLLEQARPSIVANGEQQASVWRLTSHLHNTGTSVTSLPYAADGQAYRADAGGAQNASRSGDMTLVPLLDSHPELWGWAALGKSGQVVYAHLPELADGQRNVSALAELSGVHRNTVRAALARLEQQKLAVRVGRRDWARGTNSLDDASDALGCDDRARQRRDKHLQDRAKYKRVIAKRQAQKLASGRARP